jgi:SAM-dependent methyltransferase
LIQTWKALPLSKGVLTWVPVLDAWRKHHATTGGTDTARYCYSVWLRHLLTLDPHGFKITGARVGELGPGDSIGIGLAALLSGASQYVGLDILPFSAKANLETIFEELVQLYSNKEPIPDHNEFPRVRPRLPSYEFPSHLMDRDNFSHRVAGVRRELRADLRSRHFIDYRAPWTSPDAIAAASLDLIFSQAVLEHVDGLEETYKAMFHWLKPGGYASHVIDFTSHGLSPFWNGHWAFSDWQWTLVRGRREYLLNREPLNSHLRIAQNSGFELLAANSDHSDSGLTEGALSRRFQKLNDEDRRTRGVALILRKKNQRG